MPELLRVTAWGRREPDGWRGGLRLPHPRTGAMLTFDLAVPREFAADLARQFSAAMRQAVEGDWDGVSGEVGLLAPVASAAARFLPGLAQGLARGVQQLLGGGGAQQLGQLAQQFFGGGAAPPPPSAPLPRPAPAPPPAPTPPPMVQPIPLPGLAQALGAGLIVPDLLGGASVLATAPRFSAWSPALGSVLNTALRVLDTEAGRRIGDPRARDALARARQSVEERVVRALRLVDAMLDR